MAALGCDFHVQGAVPSVALFASIPEDIHRECYRDSVTVTLKTGQPSHLVEWDMLQN